jgi:hypothetical protein
VHRQRKPNLLREPSGYHHETHITSLETYHGSRKSVSNMPPVCFDACHTQYREPYTQTPRMPTNGSCLNTVARRTPKGSVDVGAKYGKSGRTKHQSQEQLDNRGTIRGSGVNPMRRVDIVPPTSSSSGKETGVCARSHCVVLVKKSSGRARLKSHTKTT